MKCPRCQHDTPPQAQFCLECGEPVASQATAERRFTSPESYTPKHLAEKILTSKAALEGERKQVTVLFADLKGSMERNAGLCARAGTCQKSGVCVLPTYHP